MWYGKMHVLHQLVAQWTYSASLSTSYDSPSFMIHHHSIIHHHERSFTIMYHHIPPYTIIYYIYQHIPPYTIIYHHIPPYTVIHHHIPAQTNQQTPNKSSVMLDLLAVAWRRNSGMERHLFLREKVLIAR